MKREDEGLALRAWPAGPCGTCVPGRQVSAEPAFQADRFLRSLRPKPAGPCGACVLGRQVSAVACVPDRQVRASASTA